MAISDLISKEIELDLSEVPKSQWKQVKKEIIDLVIDEILRYTADGNSPVSGFGKFKTLNKKYAEKEKQGNRDPNLRLEGSMMDSLQGKSTQSGVVVGVSEAETPKADGHNNFTGESKLPLRRFIPMEDEEFKAPIMSKVNQIIDNYKEEIPKQENPMEINVDIRERTNRIRQLSFNLLEEENG